MKDKNKSFFKTIINTVSKLPTLHWLKESKDYSEKEKTKASPFSQAESTYSFESLCNMGEQEIEKLVHDIFKQRGYSVAEKDKGAYDGVDLVLNMYNETTFVQCSRWKEEQVDITAVGELYLASTVEGAQYGIVITAGAFTPEALDFSLGKPLLLINGVDLSQMIDALSTDNPDTQEQSDVSGDTSIDEADEIEPLCPLCNNKMIKRTARKGKNAGSTFWGCSRFPACRGVVSN